MIIQMYENVTYAELKNLPRDQKSEAWKELKSLYKTQKELAEKLGVSPNLVYNMISRYVKEESADGEIAKVSEAFRKQKMGRKRMRKQDIREQDTALGIISPVLKENEAFTISIKKTVLGEDAQIFLNGVGNTLLKGRKYSIEVKVTEE